MTCAYCGDEHPALSCPMRLQDPPFNDVSPTGAPVMDWWPIFHEAMHLPNRADRQRAFDAAIAQVLASGARIERGQ